MTSENNTQEIYSQRSLVTTSQVTEAMKSWAIRFKDRAPTPLEMTMMMTEYYEDLIAERFSSELFHEVVMIVRRKEKFFPKMADILSHREEAQEIISRRYQAKQQKQIPHREPPADKDFAAMCMKNIKLMLAKKITMDEAIHRNTVRYKSEGVVDLEYHRRLNHDHHINVSDEKLINTLSKGMSFDD